jgi:hypothetical protein
LEKDVNELDTKIASIKKDIKNKETIIKECQNHKTQLNKQFFIKYGKFISEGTWIDEEYIDDEKYYADGLSVLYNSCYPKVTYNINVLSLSEVKGYEHLDFDLGDETHVIDKKFFGSDEKVKVIVTETSEHLDDISKNTIKVQNFKEEFQDLFQKITAQVQQTQYNTGSYQKAVALTEASNERKNVFLSDALSAMSSKVKVAGQQYVVQDKYGLTITDANTKE